jgi:hypothetical protein
MLVVKSVAIEIVLPAPVRLYEVAGYLTGFDVAGYNPRVLTFIVASLFPGEILN